ncbi:MAG: Uma2 family endonuclease [Microscillaceae bacterium]|jgi:Uma2 family endonuclease|nr:Uma2 family endonuclease [Microscillaceae bacterium]
MQKTTIISDYEIERGKPLPSKLHSLTQLKLAVQLENNYAHQYSFFSELSLSLNGWDSVPDLAIYPKTDIDYNEDEIELKTPPLGVIEILSPTQSFNELKTKAGRYFEVGVKSCWLVIPVVKNIYVFSNREDYEIYKGKETLQDNALNISIELGEVFQ